MSIKIYVPAVLLLILPACSLDIVQVPASRVNSAKLADKPQLRGPGAPGFFKHSWTFSGLAGTQPKGYLFDPSQLEFTSQGVRMKPGAKGPAVVVTQFGPAYSALDGFREQTPRENADRVRYQLSPDNTRWYFHDGKKWVIASPDPATTNTAAEIQNAIGRFHLEAAPGNIHVKAYFPDKPSPQGGSEGLTLETLEVRGVAPRTDGWD